MHIFPESAASYPASVQVIDDSDAPNASNFNTGPGGAINRAAFLYAGRAHPGQNWRSVFGSVVGSNTYLAAAYDALEDRFVVCTLNGSASVQMTYGFGSDDGSQWGGATTYGAVTGGYQAAAICADPSTAGTLWLALVASAGGLTVYSSSGGSWTSQRSITDSAGSTFTVEMIPFNGKIIYVYGSTSASKCTISSTSPSPVSWSDFSPTTEHAAWVLKANTSLAICMPLDLTDGSPDGTYYTSPDGVTWTARTNAWHGVGSGPNRTAALAWYAPGQVWIAAVVTSGSYPFGTAFYSSADGINWTEIGSGPTGYRPRSMAAIGNTLVCTLDDGSASIVATTASAMIFSIDGGVTWYPLRTYMPSNMSAGSTGYIRTRLVAAPTQLFAFNANWGRFSHCAGLPSSHL